LAVSLATFSAASLTAFAADRTINAYVPIATTGQLLQSGTNHVSFVGVSTGMMIIETEHGLVNAGNASCTISQGMNSDTLETTGSGRCSILGSQGNHIYGQYNCTGKIGFGCKGQFSVDGGTGEFAGGKGSGTMIVRSMVAEAAFANSTAQAGASVDGIVLLKNLKIQGAASNASGN
jgi:hypothetical protein